MRALVTEDDPVSARLVRATLEPEGFLIEEAQTGEDALELVKLYDFDVVVLDMELPDLPGCDMLRRMRLANIETPVMVLSGMEDRAQKIQALIAGADDYLTKPFDRAELVARLQAIIRRSKGHASSVIRTGRLTIDLSTRAVEIDGKPLKVTGKEYRILELLSLRKGRALTKQMLLDHLYGGMDEPEQKIIDVFICKLRKKIAAVTEADHGIETVWGHGYMLRDTAPSAHLQEEEAPFLRPEDELLLEEAKRLDLDELDLLVLGLLPGPA
jgi:two-component system cell cycle response regulator CtrA